MLALPNNLLTTLEMLTDSLKSIFWVVVSYTVVNIEKMV
jgi:hypothetical protein